MVDRCIQWGIYSKVFGIEYLLVCLFLAITLAFIVFWCAHVLRIGTFLQSHLNTRYKPQCIL